MSEPDTGRTVETSVGPARLTTTEGDAGTLVIGHGAGGLRWSADLLAVRDAAMELGWATVLVDQPWRVAGRKVASPPTTLDPAWLDVLASLRGSARPLVVAGRSAGARVACRTAQQVGADAVLCVAFPLHPPGKPDRSRAAELGAPQAHGIGLQVIQGSRDPFGTPAEIRAAVADIELVEVTGAHSLEASATAVGAASLAWLRRIRRRRR